MPTPTSPLDSTAPERPDGPAAVVAGPLSGGNGISLVAATGPMLPETWVEEEYSVDGRAVSYRADGDLRADGRYTLAEAKSADYRTRIVVRRPGDAADFNGTVVVEWLNVSAGFDASPDYSYLGDELVRGGYAWVGVSAQHIGIEGGPVAVSTPVSEAAGAGRGLRALDPARYGKLHHPGDAFAYDIYTQIARALRPPGAVDALGGLTPERVLAVGESQSAFALTTYVNGVQPLAHQYDGFLIHSRGSAAAPLGEAGSGIDIAATIGLRPTTVRTDLDVPVIILETETDLLGVLNYYPARQPDSDLIRVWEVAGTSHADAYLVGAAADLMECPAPINAGGLHFVAKAALRHLDTWVTSGEPPPEAPRIEIDDTPAFVRDGNGNAESGIRTPHVAAPVDTLSGEPAEGGPLVCLLFGTTTPLPEQRLAALYDSREDYLEKYTVAADAVIDAGFVLAEDRQALLADAQPERIPRSRALPDGG